MLKCLKQTSVIRHVEHTLKCHTPRVVLVNIISLPPEDSGPLVYLAGDLHIAPAAEDGAGARVGIEESEIRCREGNAAFFVAGISELFGPVQEEGEFRLGDRAVFAAHREQAELDAAVNAGEDLLAVLEVVEGGDGLAVDEIAEEGLRRGVEGEAGRDDHAGAAGRGEQFAAEFGEDRIGVDVAAAG